MISLSHASFEIFPFPSSPPSLDFTRRRPAPTALKLGMAYQKRIPRTFKKFNSPIHPNKNDDFDQSTKKKKDILIPTGKLVLTDRKMSSIKRYMPSMSQSLNDEDDDEIGDEKVEQIYRCKSNSSTITNSTTTSSTSSISPPSQSFSLIIPSLTNMTKTTNFTSAGTYIESQAPINSIIEQKNGRIRFDEDDSFRIGIQR